MRVYVVVYGTYFYHGMVRTKPMQHVLQRTFFLSLKRRPNIWVSYSRNYRTEKPVVD